MHAHARTAPHHISGHTPSPNPFPPTPPTTLTNQPTTPKHHRRRCTHGLPAQEEEAVRDLPAARARGGLPRHHREAQGAVQGEDPGVGGEGGWVGGLQWICVVWYGYVCDHSSSIQQSHPTHTFTSVHTHTLFPTKPRKQYLFQRFGFEELTAQQFEAKAQVFLLGGYSTGKTTVRV